MGTGSSGIYLGDAPYSGGSLLHNLLLFGRVCRALGMDVTPSQMVEVARALEFVQLGSRADVQDAMRALIVRRRKDIPLFDEAFERFWHYRYAAGGKAEIRPASQSQRPKQMLMPPAAQQNDDANGTPPSQEDTIIGIVPTYSANEVLRQKNFAEMSGEELRAAQAAIAKLPLSLGERRTRRYRDRGREKLDLRRAIRRSMRYGGEAVELPRCARASKPRPLVLICDVSGSMERYTRLLLHFAHTLAHSAYQVESFVYSTRLTRITRQIRSRSVDHALHDVGLAVHDWGGGTRTGEALHRFNFRWSRRVLGRGAVVLIITDGWDRGDMDQLSREMDRLRRSCHRLIWLNPLLGSRDYQPLTRGAQAMLPYVDDFLPVHNLASLDTLVQQLLRVDWRR